MGKRKESEFSQSSIFSDIPEEKLREIVHIAQRKVVPAHTIIFRQDDPGDSFYIVNSGGVRVFRKSKEGIETDLAYLGPGESFGELSLLTGEPRSGFVETTEETDFSVFPKDKFHQILKDYPHVSSTVIKQLYNWIIQGDLRLEEEAEHRTKGPDISRVDFLIILGLGLLFGIIFNLSNPHGIKILPKSWFAEIAPETIHLQAIKQYKEGQAIFIDARPFNFFNQQHIEGAINLPLALFDIMYMMELSEIDKEKEIIVYGRTISRLYDEEVARKLILRGHKNTKILHGGLSEWGKNGYPIAS